MSPTLPPRYSPLLLVLLAGGVMAAEKWPPEGTRPIKVRIENSQDRLDLFIGDQRFCRYVTQDDKISRPYFAHLVAPCGTQVTRRHPPLEGQDATDHATFHPGLWTGYGDISGHDYWRLKARVEHVKFLEIPRTGPGWAAFTSSNKYLSTDGKTAICHEQFRFTLLVRESGYLVLWESTFTAVGKEAVFGDQEEMGLGVRVATPLAVSSGGRIVDSKGRVNGKGVWGRQSGWCDYHGRIGNVLLGVTLIPHPENFRSSWFHARDYGFVAANPFGRNAFTGQEKSRLAVTPGKPFQLRFAVHFHSRPLAAGKPLPGVQQLVSERDEVYRDYRKILHSDGGVR